MKISLDFGGSTTDLVYWSDRVIEQIKSFEFNDIGEVRDLSVFFASVNLNGVTEIRVTGGRSREFPDTFNGIPIVKFGEIDAIGNGAMYLSGLKDFLAVSMGTGTCMVHVANSNSRHVGGTGVGGGTFLALCREILRVSDVALVLKMFERGDLENVDISVGDIVGGDIGMIKADTTASNLGKLARGHNASMDDLAKGIVNLIGQVIGSNACFAARACGCGKIVLGGKLTRIKPIIDVVKKVANIHGLEVLIPKNAEYLSAIGAGI